MKWLIFLLVSIFSVMVSAHEGHGSQNPLIHNVEHFVWYVSGFAILVSLLLLALYKR